MDLLAKREEYYKDDPKKALKKFFDRLGQEMSFQYEENGIGPKHSWTCRLELPLDTSTGKAVVAEATTGGAKKDALAQCSLEACRILDTQGVLHPSANIAGDNVRKRRNAELAENDYYDSDEDTFLDRTGELERKRLRRKARIQGTDTASDRPLTYDQLLAELERLRGGISGIEVDLEALAKLDAAAAERKEDVDELDAYMREIRQDNTGALGESAREIKVKKSQKRQELVRLKTEFAQVEKMAKIAKPTEMPSAKPSAQSKIWVGSMKGFGKKKALTSSAPQSLPKLESEGPEEEEEEGGPISLADLIKEKSEPESEPAEKTPLVRSEAKRPPRIGAPIPHVVQASEPVQQAADSEAPQIEQTPEVLSTKGSGDQPTKDSTSDVPESEEADSVPESQEAAEDEGEEKTEGKKRKRQRVRNKKKKTEEELGGYDARDPDYAVWVPPDDGQSGDGRTALNDRLGY